ncbi:unnamed protein product [Cochlearia groenlandica]
MSLFAFFLFTLLVLSSSCCSATRFEYQNEYIQRKTMLDLASKIGINYGRQGNNLPSPYQSINLIKSIKAGHVKLYDADPESLTLLSQTNLYVTITVPNHQIISLGTNQSVAEDWVKTNILTYYPQTQIRFVLVGNEILSVQDRNITANVVPAMRKIVNSLRSHDIHNIKVGTSLAMDTLRSTFPPSNSTFREEITEEFISPLLRFLNGTNSYFFVNLQPYFRWSRNPMNTSLDYALFQSNSTYTDPLTGLVYHNLLDQMLDSVIFASTKLGYPHIRIAISETGWPNSGDIDETGANIFNAAIYNRNLINKITTNPPIGTPARPGLPIPTFVFSLFNENQKNGSGTQRNWGILHPNGTPIYDIDFSGQKPLTGFNPLPKPTNNIPYKGQVWCVPVQGATESELDEALRIACGQSNTTCAALAPGRECYEPVSITWHASYAVSSYWAQFRNQNVRCYFNGLAHETTTNPDSSFFTIASSFSSFSSSSSSLPRASTKMSSSSSLGSSTILSHVSPSRESHLLRFRFGDGHRRRFPSSRRFRIHSVSKEKEVSSSSSFLKSSSLSGDDGALQSSEWKAVPDIWRSSAEKYGDKVALVDPYHDPPLRLTYKQLEQEILDFAEGLRVVGAKADEKIALFADNSCRWLVSDQGIMATGAVNVVRGSRSSVEELLQIYRHSESVALVVDNPEFFNRIADTFTSKASPRFMILLWGDKSSLATQGMQIPVYSYTEITKLGQERRTQFSGSNETRNSEYESIHSDVTAAIMYTSGTTGNPKGVMLTHRNLLHQIKHLSAYVPAEVGDRFLSMLPSWHAYERACEYFIFTRGVEQMYTSIRFLKDDLRQYQPHYLISVPLVYETLYNGIQKQIASSSAARKFLALTLIRVSLTYMEMKRIYEGMCLTKEQKPPMYIVALVDYLWARVVATLLWPLHMLAKRLIYNKIHSSIGISKAGISGGGSLLFHIDKFYEAIGVNLQNGYGLTETSPVICARTLSCNVLGSAGHLMHGTEFKVVDPETNNVLPPGSKGIVKVRGPQIMKGYYKNPLTTKQVLNESGWFNTGDTGWIAPRHSTGRSRRCGGLIVLEGRAKDTIVLSTGENVEPLEIEEAAMRSSLIDQIIVIGQDQRRLGAIIIPNKEVAERVDPETSKLTKEKLKSLVYEELRKWTAECSFQVGPVLIADEPFTIENGLMTPTMKIRRDKVVAKYKDDIHKLFS